MMQDNAEKSIETQNRPEIQLDNLKYRARSIAELEKRCKRSVMEALEDSSIDNLVIFIQKGLNNCDENTAYAAIDEWTDVAKKDTFELLIYIIDTLDRQGFLARALKLKAKIQSRIDKVANMTGDEVSAL